MYLHKVPLVRKRGRAKQVLMLLFLFIVNCACAETFQFNLTFIVKNDTTDNKAVSLNDYLVSYKIKDKKMEYLAHIKREKGFRLDLESGEEYTFTFTKPGYTMQKVVVDTKIPDKRDKEKFRKMLCILNFEKAPIEFIVGNSKPVVRICYRPDIKEFDYDPNYTFAPIDVDLIKKRDKLFNKAWWLLHDGNYKGALAAFADLIQKNPQDLASIYNHGKAAFKLNDKKTACADWSKVKSMNKEFADNLLKSYCSEK